MLPTMCIFRIHQATEDEENPLSGGRFALVSVAAG
jgi:hypothetical protein